MRVFLAGATGAIGRRLVPMLLDAGHEVLGMTRSAEKASSLRAAGAEPVVCDALDAAALGDAVLQARPEAVVHELTAIPQQLNPRRIERDFVLTDRLRTEGTRNLVAAAQAAGAQRILAQSVAFVYEPDGSGRPHGEEDPLYRDVPKAFRRTFGAIKELESTVDEAGGTVLRYGYFYGPGTALAADGSLAAQARRRQLPIVRGGSGVWSFIHIDDAARATVAALSGPPGIYNVVDDEPAPTREWIPAFCEAVGARRPMRVPAFVARIAAGTYGALVMTRAEGASNARAKQQLGWIPEHRTWREGFRHALD
ncbi:MAG TPA: NAD(P)-dependent oxidoreductase [Solirubrobacteraceae bacterium]|jgi:nucleoside-diphosphate-sugar epimerase